MIHRNADGLPSLTPRDASGKWRVVELRNDAPCPNWLPTSLWGRIKEVPCLVGGLEGPCWEWQGALKKGYGEVTRGLKIYAVHILVFKLAGKVIPEGLTIDHLCKRRACCNPTHLEAVTQRVNNLRGDGASGVNARKTHCIRGHEFTESNTYRDRKGRRCRACAKVNHRKSYEASKVRKFQ